MIIDVLKESMRPSSAACLLVLVAPGVALLHAPRLARWGRRWLSAVVALYWLLSAPIAVGLLSRTLTHGYAPVDAAQVKDAQAVVLLSAGSQNFRADGQQLPLVAPTSAWRVLEAARIYHLAAAPIVIATGGANGGHDGSASESEALRLALIDLAVPADRIVRESASANTWDEAVAVSAMLRERGLTRVVLVTSPTHMRRSLSVFARQGVHPLPAIAPMATERRGLGIGVLPTIAGIQLGDAIVYEWAARGYYWWRGWLS